MKIYLPIFFSFCCSLAIAQSINQDPIKNFLANSGSKITIDKSTGNVSRIVFSKAIGNQYVALPDPSATALNFIFNNSALMRHDASTDTYVVKSNKTDNYGFRHVTLQKSYKGVPIFDGQLRFHYNKNGQLATFNGNVFNFKNNNPIPTLSEEIAKARGKKHVVNFGNYEKFKDLSATKSTLYFYQKNLISGGQGAVHLVYQIELKNNAGAREYVMVDAHDGSLVEKYTGTHEVLDRKLYNQSILPANLVWQEGNAFPGTLNVWQQSEIESAGHMYYMMKNAFNYTSYNNADATMITTHNNPNIQCPNANWNGVSANYCDQTAADDVVAHEWGHAYTEYTNDLIYAFQSGALNESYSDIWGETVDQINGYFDAGETAANKWEMGEKASAFGGAIRNMYNPNLHGHPGRVGDPMFHCDQSDGGGVHLNSGVHNHAYSLLADGGVYNGQVINGIGLTKAAHIFWYAQNIYVTQTTNFAEQADNLLDAANMLIGEPLKALSTGSADPGLFAGTITAADVAELEKVLLATEMTLSHSCEPLLTAVPDKCVLSESATNIYVEDFEDGLTGWTTAASGANSATTWAAVANPANGNSTGVAFGATLDGGNCSNVSFAALRTLTSPSITIPSGSSTNLFLSFDHYLATEFGYDGGNISFSVNGGAYSLVPLSAFTANRYNVTFATDSDNPVEGQAAFSGTDGGEITGSWGQSRINLTTLGVDPGESVQFRFNLSQDGCGALDGWYIDNVNVYTCPSAASLISFASISANTNESLATTPNPSIDCLPYTEINATLNLSAPPTIPVTVNLSVVGNPSASLGNSADFSLTTNSVTFPAGNQSQSFKIRVYNDDYVELTESASIKFDIVTVGSNVAPGISNQRFTFSIIDDDLAAGFTEVTYLNETFEELETPLPPGWTVELADGNTDPDAGVYPESWAVLTLGSGNNVVIANSGDTGPGTWDKYLVSPVINTLGATDLFLTYNEQFIIYNGLDDFFDENTSTEVFDGNIWVPVKVREEAGGNFAGLTSIDISAYANANMQIRFRYQADWDNYWLMDNINVSSKEPKAVATTVNTLNPAEAYLGPLQTAVFYDPATGNLLAKIQNQSSHDYGCTTVEIDRSGTGSMPWVFGYQAAGKSIKVTPTTNNPTGLYTITIYYTDAEIAGFSGGINSMGKSGGSIVGATTGNFAEVVTTDIYDADNAYTATFDSGFSGFALSNAPPVGPLSVNLLSFNGKNSGYGNNLMWATSSETNNSHFIIERSVDAAKFEPIGQIKSHGNSKELLKYSYLDKNIENKLYYYRLRDVDMNGKKGFSKIISINNNNENNFGFWPNPSNSILNIKLKENGLVLYKIFDLTGKLIFENKENAKDNQIQISIANLPKGLYHLQIIQQFSSTISKIIKD